MSYSPGGLKLAEGNQYQGQALYNENLFWVEFFALRPIVKDRDLTAPPGSPSVGDTYIVGTGGGSGAWSGFAAGSLAQYYGGWKNLAAPNGAVVYVDDEDLWLERVESTWCWLKGKWPTTEHWTGRYSNQGNKIYTKALTVASSLSDNTTTNTGHSVGTLRLTDWLFAESEFYDGSTYGRPFGAFQTSSIGYRFSASNLEIRVQGVGSSVSAMNNQVRIEYTK